MTPTTVANHAQQHYTRANSMWVFLVVFTAVAGYLVWIEICRVKPMDWSEWRGALRALARSRYDG